MNILVIPDTERSNAGNDHTELEILSKIVF